MLQNYPKDSRLNITQGRKMQFIEILFAVVLVNYAEGKYPNQQLFKHI